MARVGLVVNPAAGRDVRRLVGGASVSDTYSKRRAAECVLAGTTLADGPVEVVAMGDKSGIAQRAVEEFDGPDAPPASVLDAPVTGTRQDTQEAAARFREEADCVVVLGGDGTTRDVALEVGDVPVAAVSTGTNNVVPTPVDGTVAGAGAALLATGEVDVDAVTTRHSMVEARVDGHADERTIRGLATLGLVDRQFVGTRAIVDAADFLGGVVSRANRREIGLSGIAGALTHVDPTDPGGVGLELAAAADRSVRAITLPGVVERVGVAASRRLDADEAMRFELDEGVVSVDGERHLEVRDATVTARPVPGGPRILDFDRAFEVAALAD